MTQLPKKNSQPPTKVRLNKYLAQLGLCSRRAADRYLTQGLVQVDGQVITQLGTQINPQTQKVQVQKKTLQAQQKLTYYLLHKPTGYTTAMQRTQLDPQIVTDLVPPQPRVFPVGRLDKLTTGLLLLTNDGVLAYHLTHPKFACAKEYEATLAAPLTKERERKVAAGMRLAQVKTQPVQIKRLTNKRVRVILTEGKNRQVRKIFGKVGCEVCALKRIRVQNLLLSNLPIGQYRVLKKTEVQELLALK